MILGQANEISNFPTTLLGLIGLALALIINDWVKNRGKNSREDTKVNELSEQTKLLREIRDRQISKKIRRRIKKMASQIDEIHAVQNAVRTTAAKHHE